jgi:NitT/TauT family transport system permease protein
VSSDGKRSRIKADASPAALVRVLPGLFALALLSLWAALSGLRLYPESVFPSPGAVAAGFAEEVTNGHMSRDIVASLFRVAAGFSLAVSLGVPLGLWLGHSIRARTTFQPAINFFRSLSPLAWIPFAILWFGIGDAPTIFLIFMSTFFPLALATTAAVANIPSVYFRVAHDCRLAGISLLHRVTLPAIMPQVIIALRVTAGLAWLVVVAAEMIAGRDGLGFAIWDARNGLRMDLLVVKMIVIGVLGVAVDRALLLLTRIPSMRWGYDR